MSAITLSEAEQRTFIAIGKLCDAFTSKAVALAVLRPALALHAGVEGEMVTSALYCLMRTGLIDSITIGDPKSPKQLPGYRLTELGVQTYATMSMIALVETTPESNIKPSEDDPHDSFRFPSEERTKDHG